MCERDSGGIGIGTWCQRRHLVSTKSSGHRSSCDSEDVSATKDENNNDINGDQIRLSSLCSMDDIDKEEALERLNPISFRSSSKVSKSQLLFIPKSNKNGSGVSGNLYNNKKNKISPVCSFSTSSIVLLIILFSILFGSFLPKVESVCVWQGGGGFRLACGFRQSGLFRIRSLGGLKGYLGAGFTIGDEDGFKDSLTSTDPVKNNYQHPAQGQVYPNGYQRVGIGSERLPTPLPYHNQHNNGGVPLSLEELKKQEQLRYLQQIQTEQMLEQQVLQQQAYLQSQQKQQFQNRRLPIPSQEPQQFMSRRMESPTATSPSHNQRSGGGITKRASAWGWPFNKKNQNNNSPNNGRKSNKSDGPPPMTSRNNRGPPPPLNMQQRPMRPVMIRGPPPPNFQPIHPQNQYQQIPFQRKQMIQGPGPYPRNFQPSKPSFSNPSMSPPMIHSSMEKRRGYAPHPQQQADYEDGEEEVHHSHQIRNQNQFKLPHQMMMPPPSPSSSSPQQIHQFRQQPQIGDVRHLQFSQPTPSQIPRGLQMLQNTENYGSMYRLVDKQSSGGGQISRNIPQSIILPPSAPPPQNQIHRSLPTTQEELEDEENFYLSGLGNLDRDALATAVYDPNIFPDIYFTSTTTERGNSLLSSGYADNNNDNEEEDAFVSQNNRDAFTEDEEFLHPLDTAALHTNENNVDRISKNEDEMVNQEEINGDNNQDFEHGQAPASNRKKGRRRRKKFRLLKKTGDLLSSDVSQSLDFEDNTNTEEGQLNNKQQNNINDDDALLINPNTDNKENEDGGEIETNPDKKKMRRRKKGKRRRKKPHHLRTSNSTSTRLRDESELIREAISSGREENHGEEQLPILGPSPLTLTFTDKNKKYKTNSNKIPTTTPTPTTTTTKSTTRRTTTTTTTTTTPRVEISRFGYHEALDKKLGSTTNKNNVLDFNASSNNNNNNNDPYHEESGSSSSSGSKSIEQLPYDPRYPPNHEINKGRIPNKFIRQRGGGGNVVEPKTPSTSTTTPTPFLSGGLNVLSPFSSSSNSNSRNKLFYNEPRDSTPESVVKFSPSTELSSSFVKFDSRESIKSIERTRQHNDKFYTSHFNKSSPSSSNSNNNNNFGPTAFSNPGFYDASSPSSFSQEGERFNHNNNEPRPSSSSYPTYPRPPSAPSREEEVLLPWEQPPSYFSTTTIRYPPSRSMSPVPIYPRKSNTVVFDRYNNGPTSPSFPSSTAPSHFKKTLFGGEDDDDNLNNWEAPNFWGSIQQVDRYGPTSDFVTNDNFKRVLDLDQQVRNSFQQEQEQQYQQGPSLRPPPEPPVFNDHEHNFHSTFFDSTPTNFIPSSSAEPKWDHYSPKRKLDSSPSPLVTTTPTPFYSSSSSPHSDLGQQVDEEEENEDGKIHQLPVKEIELDDFGTLNNFNFISSTTSTTEVPEMIKNMRIKHRGKKRKQKRPEVSIKIRGDNDNTPTNLTLSPPTPTQQQQQQQSNFVAHHIIQQQANDILAMHEQQDEEQDSKAKESFNIGHSIDVKTNDGSSVAHNGFDGNFVPSSSPFLKDSLPSGSPFSNFDSVIPKNPFTFNSNSNNNQNINNNGGASSELNRHVNQMTGFDDGRQGQGQNNQQQDGQMSSIPSFQQNQQQQQSSEEHRQIVHHPNEIPRQYGSGSHLPPPSPTMAADDNEDNFVPSSPDPVLKSEIISFGVGGNNRFQFPTSIPVLRPPNFDNSGDLRWEPEVINHEDIDHNQQNIQNAPRKIIPHPIQILNIRNQIQQQPQQQPPPSPPKMSGNDFYGSSFQNFQQNFNQNPQQINYQNQNQHNFDKQNNNGNQDEIKPFNVNASPSIKLVRPNNNQQQQQQNQNHFQGPPVSSPQNFPYEQIPFKMFQMPQKPTQSQSQLPYQLVHVPVEQNPVSPQKIQFQKNSPPKKYQQENMNKPQQVYQPTNSKNNIPLPKNPYMGQNNNNNHKKLSGYQSNPTKIPAQKFQPPPPLTAAPSFLSRLNPFNRGSASSSSSNSQSSSSNSNRHQSQQSNNNNNNNRYQPPSSQKGVEVTYVDLDDNLSPPRLIPQTSMPHNGNRQNKPPPSSNSRPFPPRRENAPLPPRPMSEKDKVLQAIATLNNVKYDVIQSVAEEQFGSEILDRIKAKKAQEHMRLTITTTTTTPRPPMLFPILTTMAPLAGSFLNMMGSAANAAADSINSHQQQQQQKKYQKNDHQRMSPSGISNLLSSFGGYGDSAAAPPSRGPTITSLSTDAITNLFNSLTSGELRTTTTPRTTTTTQSPIMVRLDSMVENSGGSMEFLSNPNQDIKSLQAQLAKAILAKANRKKNSGYNNNNNNINVGPPTSPNPLGLLNSLAQSKNYTQNQISTLKKLIALNNIEQKLNHQLGLDQSTTQKLTVGPTIKSLLAPSGPSVTGLMNNPNSMFSHKMLRDPEFQMLNTVQNSGGSNGGLDPTLLALKAYALRKAQSIQQPNVMLNSKKQQDETGSSSDFKPIPVDLSAILSPAPPLEEPRKRRLTDVRNAPKSFYPANATQGFDTSGSGPGSALSTEFSCEGQNFFPGLYADTGLGCKVFHLCAKTDAGYLLKSFRCPRETVFDQEVLKCNWSLYVDCDSSEKKYDFNKYLSQSFQFLKVLGEFSKNTTTNGK